MSLPKLLFVHDSKYEVMDGLWAALNLLEKDFEITKLNLQTETSLEDNFGSYDFMLGWGGFQSPVDKWLQVQSRQKKGLCIGGNSFPLTEGYDMYFYETEFVKDYLRLPKNSVHAFGINSDLYNQPNMPFPLIWDYIGVGSFSYWKRWDKMKDKKGTRLVVGEYQKDNEQESSRIALDLLRNGVMVSGMVNPFDLSNFYHWSRTLYIPAEVNGGGERAVWEAKACGLSVECESDNLKLLELINSPVKDHIYYASKLKEGILSVL